MVIIKSSNVEANEDGNKEYIYLDHQSGSQYINFHHNGLEESMELDTKGATQLIAELAQEFGIEITIKYGVKH